MSSGPDLGGLLRALDDHRVSFVVAGSVAAMAHGAADIDPGDLDVIPATDPANLSRLAAALGALRAEVPIETGEWRTDDAGEHVWMKDGIERPARSLDPQDSETFDHSFATSLGRLDVVPRIAGRYGDLRPRASRLAIAGRRAWVAHPVDILAGMTGPRRPKDGSRVRHLRARATAPSGIGFVGLRTDRFEAMVGLFRDLIGLDVVREAPGATWFRLGADAELHVYADTDPDHVFFTTGPVVGLRVEDVDATRAALAADGLELLTEVERTDVAAWCHFRARDGTVLEIIGPAG
ncbi:MAG TPA: VOC family protein [Candidatus Binatia bacterium]|nr:VOC family protein [Candidatus Binatia bacterium]